MSDGTKLAASLAVMVLAVVVGALGYLLLPFKAAGNIPCASALKGAEPQARATAAVALGKEQRFCDDKANGRLAAAGLFAMCALAVGVGAVLLPPSGLERLIFEGDASGLGPD